MEEYTKRRGNWEVKSKKKNGKEKNNVEGKKMEEGVFSMAGN